MLNFIYKYKYWIMLAVLALLSFTTIIYVNFKKEEVFYSSEISSLSKKEVELKTDVIENDVDVLVAVDVKGEVNFPGVYYLNENSIVLDAINMAGGFSENALVDNINLSQYLKEEMVIFVFSKEENLDVIKNEDIYIDSQIDNKESISSKNSDSNVVSSELININSASLDELKKLPGIGDSKASAIISYRENEKNFQVIDDIMNVSGIGNATFENIKNFITV